MSIFVFMQVGDDPNVDLMVKSINLSNPSARIIQCSDPNTKKITGVSEVYRLDSDTNNLMTFRLEIFSKLNLSDSAIYLDTDILVLKEITAKNLLEDADVALCHRSFNINNYINTKIRNIDLSEYSNRTIGQIYPIIACFTVSKSHEFWRACLSNLLKLDSKFHYWYGDQEAMRNIADSGKFSLCYMPESKVACLPEYFNEYPAATGLHFKGPNRKQYMNKFYEFYFK